MRILVANRGEIATRIAKACHNLNIQPIAVYSHDDPGHLSAFGEQQHHILLSAAGPTAYMDPQQYIDIAKNHQIDAIHPGYGFLSESAQLAKLCERNNIVFIGPNSQHLAILGDKVQALQLATRLTVPVLDHYQSNEPTALENYFTQQTNQNNQYVGILKAISGGGGRGMSVIDSIAKLKNEFQRQSKVAEKFFGDGSLYLEQYLPSALHLEVQVLGSGEQIAICGVRDCSIQRNRQKVIEMTPSPFASAAAVQQAIDYAFKMADDIKLTGLATFEFLVDKTDQSVFFIECNPRCQVEHTITEEYFGIDLISEQIICCLPTLLDQRSPKITHGLQTGHLQPPVSNKMCIQIRLCAEQMSDSGTVTPVAGSLQALALPNVNRIDSNPLPIMHNEQFDSLLAKLIYVKEFADTTVSTTEQIQSALADLSALISADLQHSQLSMDSNIPLLSQIFAMLAQPNNHLEIQTNWLEQNLTTLTSADASSVAALDSLDPLAVLAHGKRPQKAKPRQTVLGEIALPFQGLLISNDVAMQQQVNKGDILGIVEAMKMEHEIVADCDGIIDQINYQPQQTVTKDSLMFVIQPAQQQHSTTELNDEIADLDHIREDLQELIERRAKHLDVNRPEAVAKRRKTNQRTVRENIEDLCDNNSFKEYGDMVVAAQRTRRPLQDLIDRTPGDGMVCGIGTVNAKTFGEDKTQCVLMSYDYTVLAGTQGKYNHTKKDRMFKIAQDENLPVVLFAEGGGGRPGDVDVMGVAGLDCLAFRYLGELSGQVPLVGIVSGRCFAGNAALLGCCDVIIATENANIGMGGPAMIEGGGLGIYTPDEIGPIQTQTTNGVVDIAVKDETEAVAAAKQYLAYFQGDTEKWEAHDQRKLRHIIPENRLRVYQIRKLIDILCDRDSVTELRSGFGLGMITVLARIHGKTVGIIANDPIQTSGAIQSNGADKAARFMQLCDAFNIPIVSLIDTPGIMVGIDAEESALVRHAARLFVVSGGISVPVMAIVIRKAYGLGAQAMAAGSFHSTMFTLSWPTGEFGGMGLEGATKLAYRKELEAEKNIAQRKQMYDKLVAKAYDRGKAINMASFLEIDSVIDPVETREWIHQGILVHRSKPVTKQKSRYIDTW